MSRGHFRESLKKMKEAKDELDQVYFLFDYSNGHLKICLSGCPSVIMTTCLFLNVCVHLFVCSSICFYLNVLCVCPSYCHSHLSVGLSILHFYLSHCLSIQQSEFHCVSLYFCQYARVYKTLKFKKIKCKLG